MNDPPVGNGFSAATSPRNLRPPCAYPRLQPGKYAKTGDRDWQDRQGAAHPQTTALRLMQLNSAAADNVGGRYLIKRWFEPGAPVNRVPVGPRRGLSFHSHSPV
jgi:hypothetical protein